MSIILTARKSPYSYDRDSSCDSKVILFGLQPHIPICSGGPVTIQSQNLTF